MKSVIFSQQHVSDFIKSISNVNNEAKYVCAYNFTNPVIVLAILIAKEVISKHSDIDATPNEMMLHKNLLTTHLSSLRRKFMFDHAMKKKDILIKYIEKLLKNSENMVNVTDLFSRYNNDMLASFIIGLDVDSLNDPENDFYKYAKKYCQLKGVTKTKLLIKRAYTWLTEKLEITSFMSMIAYELALNIDIQAKLQTEIDQVLQKTTDAVINESMRVHPASFIQRTCKSSFELPPALPGLKPFVVQPEIFIWIPTSVFLNDPNTFRNPSEFDPDRFIRTNVGKTINNISFGMGSRSCIGKTFAIFNLKIMLFYVLAKFSFKTTVKTQTSLVYDPKYLSPKVEGGTWLSFESRRSGKNSEC
ncbi:cytochrome P450 3A16-like [Phymastichus coffea]|uniref:cytochrome P450 3A16-like n=1 Tax=Phymastichus coffea TaxID=108790 RepID=UPI00273BAA41|nr:cytochrome P450 3A16-like [Phymastichus coffea]